MIKHSLKENIVYISIDKLDFSYRIPTKKIGNMIDWNVGTKGANAIVIKDVSIWTLQLFTKKTIDDKYIKQFMAIVQEYSPDSNINWGDTYLAVNIQNQYNYLTTDNHSAEKKNSEDEVISILKKRYQPD